MPDSILKEMYYRSFKEQYVIDKKLFEIDQKCTDIFIITSGVVEITLSDGINQ